ncbi:MAG: glycosyltransferase family 2 protein [Brevundimonas sp.]|uniref:glycosyltransferase family 2 protein n=1 Tax=Brevundimonas sp. TaxID=1871086 RepID=UPI003919D82C
MPSSSPRRIAMPAIARPSASPFTPDVAVVVPVHDEAGNAAALAREIAAAFSGRSFEVIFVDDASRDSTRSELLAAREDVPQLRVLSHTRNAGQSRAVQTGILAARAPVVVTLDGDGQNPPFEAPKLVDALIEAGPRVALVGGERVDRQDTASKRSASRLANGIRKWLLKDSANDTGCGLKAMRRDVFLRLPYFDHMHRYLPALVIREGYQCRFLPVSHRARGEGRSKYTNLGRLWAALSDLIGIMWLRSRGRLTGQIEEH